MFLLGLAIAFLIGWLLISSLGLAREGAMALGLALGCGLGLTAMGHLSWLAFFPAVPNGYFMVDLVILGVLLAYRGLKGPGAGSVEAPASEVVPPWLMAGLAVVCLLGAGLVAWLYHVKSQGVWDGIVIWNTSARFLFAGEGHWTDKFSSALAHPDYPLLLPLAVARAWRYAGSTITAVPFGIGISFLAATLLLLFGALSRFQGAGSAVLGVLLLLGSPDFIGFGASQIADVPLSFFILATLTLSHVAVNSLGTKLGQRAGSLAGLCAGLAANTKNEGVLFALVFVVSLGLWHVFRRHGRPAHELFARAGLGVAAGMSVVLALKRAYPVPNDLFAERTFNSFVVDLVDLSRYATALKLIAAHGLIASSGLGVLLLLLVWGAGLDRAKWQRWWATPLFTAPPLLLIGYFFIYIITPHDITWHIVGSLNRLMAHVYPSLVLGCMLLLNSLFLAHPADNARFPSVEEPSGAPS